MALDFSDATGNLFNRLGKIFGGIEHANAFLDDGDLSAGGIESVGVFIDFIDDEFDASRQDLAGGLYQIRDSARQALNGLKQQLSSMAQQVLIQMVNDDHPLTALDLTFAITELIRQMNSGTQSVNSNVTTVSATPGTNYGNHTLIASVKGVDGVNREYVEDEQITVICITDANSGAVAAGNEEWVAAGVTAVGGLDWNWPKGSGGSVTFSSTSPGGGLSLLVNGDMELFTEPDEPDFWTIDVGTPGTSIKMATSPHTGTNNLRFVGGAAELTSIYQSFEDGETGTSLVLQPSTIYGVACYAKVSASGTGVLELSLTDESGTIIQDDEGVDQKITKTVASMATSYGVIDGFFNTPKILPEGGFRFRVRMSTALSAINLDIDDIVMGQAVEVYKGGPWIFLIPGDKRAAIGDRYEVNVENNHDGKFQDYFQRCFDMRSMGLQLPSSTGSETILDSLIV